MKGLLIPYCFECGVVLMRTEDIHLIKCGNVECQEFGIVYRTPIMPLMKFETGNPDLAIVGTPIRSIKECLHHAKRTHHGFFVNGKFLTGDEVLLMKLMDLVIAIDTGAIFRRSPT